MYLVSVRGPQGLVFALQDGVQDLHAKAVVGTSLVILCHKFGGDRIRSSGQGTALMEG